MNSMEAWEALRKSWSARPPIDDVAAFDAVEETLGQRLPANYKGFLMDSNGGETQKPLTYVRFYGLDELLTRRITAQPLDLLEIAIDESTGFAFDLRVNRDGSYYPVVASPLGTRDRTQVRRVSRHFAEFLATIASGKEPQWRARIEIMSPGSGSPSQHPSDQPEEAFNVQGAWEAIRNYWFANPPVDDAAEFESVEESLRQHLPADYKWFLMQSNGGEALEPLERVRLYRLEELLPRREDGQPPDVLEIATNDSDGYAFDLTIKRETANYRILRYSLGEQDRAYVESVSRHFAEFLTLIASGEEP